MIFRQTTATLGLLSAAVLSTAAWAQTDGDDVLTFPDRDEDAVVLDDIVVSATGFGQLIEDAPASISTVSREQIEKRAYKDVTDVVQDMPGVVVTGSGSSQDISIRGMGAKYTMILVDGKRVNSRETRPNSDGPGIEQGWLPPVEAIERVEVIRGPMSSLYGSDAMGGVINIITRKVPEQWRANLHTETTLQQHGDAGSIYQGNLWAAGPLIDDTLGVEFYGQGWKRNEDDIIGGFAGSTNQAGTVKLNWAANAHNDISAEVGYSHQTRETTYGRSAEPNPGRGQFAGDMSAASYYQRRYALTHSGEWGGITGTSYIQHIQTDNKSRDMALETTEAKSMWTLPLGDHIVSAGAQFQHEKLQDLTNTLNNGQSGLERDQWALFTEDEWWLLDDLSLTGGLRMTHDSNYGTHWTPRLYSVWHIDDNFSLKGGVSAGFKAPSLRAATEGWGQPTGGPGGNAVILGNSDLKPEKSTTGEIGLHWRNHHNLSTSLTLYQTEFRDMISERRLCDNCTGPDGHGYDFISKRVNVDKARIRGVEATLTWDIIRDLRLMTNYTYTHSEQRSGPLSGQPLNKMPKHMINATLDWQTTAALGLWSRVNFRSKTSDYLFRGGMNEGTPSFAYVDTGLNYKLTDNVSTGLAVYNVFDKHVYAGNYSPTVYDDGRRYWLRLSVDF